MRPLVGLAITMALVVVAASLVVLVELAFDDQHQLSIFQGFLTKG